jgi:uncharacterized coiled-coil protein SlyX
MRPDVCKQQISAFCSICLRGVSPSDSMRFLEVIMNRDEKRLNELELRYMGQEKIIEELSDEVALCHKRLNELERQNRTLSEMMQNLAPTSEESPDE